MHLSPEPWEYVSRSIPKSNRIWSSGYIWTTNSEGWIAFRSAGGYRFDYPPPTSHPKQIVFKLVTLSNVLQVTWIGSILASCLIGGLWWARSRLSWVAITGISRESVAVARPELLATGAGAGGVALRPLAPLRPNTCNCCWRERSLKKHGFIWSTKWCRQTSGQNSDSIRGWDRNKIFCQSPQKHSSLYIQKIENKK